MIPIKLASVNFESFFLSDIILINYMCIYHMHIRVVNLLRCISRCEDGINKHTYMYVPKIKRETKVSTLHFTKLIQVNTNNYFVILT